MPYNIDVNINFGSANANFQQLIENNAKLQATIDNLSKTIQDFGQKTTTSNNTAKKSITDYAGSYKNLSTEIAKNRKQLLDEFDILDKLRKTRKNDVATIDEQVKTINKLEKEINQQTSALNKYNKTLGITTSASKQANLATKTLSTAFGSLQSILGLSFGIYGAFQAVKSAITAVAEFDLAQKKLQSILAETNDGMKTIAASAVEIGKGSIFGAKGVTDLQIELAKMGFAKEEIIAMQGAIVNLATATQEELAPSAEVVANIIRSFELTAADATMVVDTMGKAFNDSALDLSNFREAIKYVAPIAKQANFTFAETTALLEQLSNAGIKGSLAGTGLTNILSRLGNENSKFVKTLGRTVNGFDDFLAALVELKNKGANLTDIFQLVDRRAAATFSILLEGVDTVEQFKNKLQDASGVMEEQAGVQLESISFKAKLLKENWKAMIIEMDESTNVITGLAGAFLNLGNSIITAFGDPANQAHKLVTTVQKETSNINNLIEGGFVSLAAAEKEVYKEKLISARNYYDAISDLETKYQRSIAAAQELPIGMSNIAIAKIKNQFVDQLAEIKKEFKDVDGVISSLSIETTNKALKPYVDEFVRLSNETGDLNQAWLVQVGRLSKLRDSFPKASLNAEVYRKAIAAITAEFDRLNKTGLDPVESGTKEDALRKRIQFQIDILEAQKAAAIEKIKLDNDGYNQTVLIARKELEFDKQILSLKKDLAIANGESEVDAVKKNTAEMTKAELAYLNEVDKAYKESFKMKNFGWSSLLETSTKSIEEQKKNYIKFLEDVGKQYNDVLVDMLKSDAEKRKFKKDNPIASLLGIGNETELDIAKQGFDFIKSEVSDLADAYVSAMDKIVESRNRMVDEAEQALQTELQLAELGFANNVTLKRAELAEAQKLREQAIEEQYKAAKIQVAIDTAIQSQSLITSAAQLIASGTKFGIPGLLLAFGAITLMFSTFKRYQLLAQENAAQKFETGGEVGGRRHSQGGTMIEAEKGEYVVNRKSTLKHKKLVEAINNDDQYSLNRIYLNNLKSGVLTARVSLDDSQDLKAIRKALEKNGKEITYYGTYRIEKVGNVTSKINMN